MAKKKKRRKIKQPDKTSGRYSTMINHGRILVDQYRSGQLREKQGRLDRIYKHYSRESIQRGIFEHAAGRQIAALRKFSPMFPALRKPEDILQLAFSLAERGKLWPSFHGTISRNLAGQRLVDLVMEVDFKSSWKVAFHSARPLVKFLEDFGVDFKIKFSGHSSPHIIVPAEAFPPGIGHSIQMRILDYASKNVRGKGHLDMSFQNTKHFLRLPYSINENAGGVSVPIHPDPGNPHAYSDFTPEKAKIENVRIIKDWWAVPEDAPDRTSEMIKFVLERKTLSIPKTVKTRMPRKIPAKQFQQLSTQLLLAGGPKARTEVLRRLQMPYDQMLKTGQDLLQRRDELMENANVQEAMAMLEAIHKTSGVVSVQEASSKHEVSPEELWFLWKWRLRQSIFDYYARDDVQEAMFLHSMDRKVKLGAEDVVVELADPADILPLAAYIHETQGGVDYPTFSCANIKQDATTNDIIGCDVVARVDGKGDGAAAERMAHQAISLLRQAGADFVLLLGVRSASDIQDPVSSIQSPVLNIILPSEALPGMPGDEKQFAKVIDTIEEHLKRALPSSYNISVLPMGEYLPLFYSVNGTSGVANIPVRADELRAEPKPDSLDDVRVTRDWWDVPGEVSAEMEELFTKITAEQPVC